MKARFYNIVIGVLIFTIIIDFLIFRIINTIAPNNTIVFILHGVFAVAFYVVAVALLTNRGEFRENILRNKHYGASGLLVLFYVPKIFIVAFNLLEEILWFLYQVIASIIPVITLEISRMYPFTIIGISLGIVLFIAIFFGIIWGKFFYQVKHVHLSSTQFPKKLNEFRLVQISDFHIGSFRNFNKQFEKAMKIVNKENPDLICFTGDMVNMFAEEAEPFVSALQQLKAPYGKFAILGNHDYGEYYPWNSQQEWVQNMEDLKEIIQLSGFELLLNESKRIGNDAQHFVLAGVENWGLPPFPQYGDLTKAMKDIKNDPFIILLSHDPSHWEAQVKNYPNVFLTLSGHTHAMQFGIGLGGWRWSPVKWKYKNWAGLYSENGQHLYVNKGLGFIGFPGRVGMYPEITVFHLTSEDSDQTTSNL